MKKLAITLALVLPAVALAGASASAFKSESRRDLGANHWNAQSAIDGKMETAWMVPGESANRGEWIMIDVPKGEIDKIGIFPGFGENEETYSDYARVKKLKIDVLCCADSDQMTTQATGHAEVADKAEYQIIDIEDLKVGNEFFGGKAKIWIVDIYDGRDYPNVALSEIQVIMKEFDAASNIEESSDENPDHIIMDMQDQNKKTFWATPAEGAYWEFSADGYGLSSFQIDDGPAGWARAKKVKVTANNMEKVVDLPEKAGTHTIQIPAPFGYNGSAFGSIRVDVLEVYPGTSKPDLAIAEFRTKATSYEGI